LVEHTTENRGVAGSIPALAIPFDGRMAGVWSHRVERGRVVVEVEPFAGVSAAVRSAPGAEAQRLVGFLDGDLEPSWA
jgi:hypothetical protein